MDLTEKKRRVGWIDALRGLAIILVIVGHANGVPQDLRSMIYGFHMPLFFVLSGFLTHPENYSGISAFSQKRFKQYVIPYFILGVVNLIIQAVREAAVMSWTELLKSTGLHFVWLCYSWSNAKKMPNCTPLWFLPTLFLSAVFVYAFLEYGGFIARREKSRGTQIAAFSTAVAAVAAMLYVNSKGIKLLPWHIDMAVAGFIFMLFGYSMRNYVLSERKWYTFLPLLIIGIGMIWKSDEISMSDSDIGNPVLFFAGACGTCLALLLLFKRFYRFRLRVLEFAGRNTMIVIGFNYVFRDLCNSLWKALGNTRGGYYWALQSVAVYALCLFAMLIWTALKKIFPRIAIF